MKFLRLFLFAVICVRLVPAANAQSADPSIRQAKLIFQKFVKREAAFDPTLANLYSNSAHVYTLRHMKSGRVRPLNSSAREFKRNLPATLKAAKRRNDRNLYSRVRYLVEDDNVRIRAMRYSQMKKYSSPFTLLVGPDSASNGDWKILEDISETRW